MENQPEAEEGRGNRRLLFGAILFAALAAALVLLAIFGRTTRAGDLLPLLATPTVYTEGLSDFAPLSLSFGELNADPVAYLNRPVQVSGSFLPLDPPKCARHTGPNSEWALVSEELQLEALGFERLLRILEPGTAMTVQGIWRLYQGPLGCDKGPPFGSAWYLQVQRIVQPNPLIGSGTGAPMNLQDANPGLPSLIATGIPTETPVPTPTQDPAAPLATATAVLPTAEITTPPTATIDSTAFPTVPATATAATATAEAGSTPLPTSSPSPTATSASGGGQAPTETPGISIPPTSTQTSGGGYPGPATSTPPSSYP